MSECCFGCIFAIIGGLVLVKWLVSFAFFVKRHFIGYPPRKASNDEWAVVTGASDGIGRAYAIQASKLGYNVLLISRTKSKLDDVAKEISTLNSKIQTRVIAADFANTTEKDWSAIQEAVNSVRVGLLVNNVGINYDFPARFCDPEATDKKDRDIVEVNINVLNRMTKIVLPGMLKNKSGSIVNLSSFAGKVPSPMLAVYSGTKAYIDFFSQSLHGEYAKFGINVLSVTPAMVVSNMSKIRKPSLTVAEPNAIARASLGLLGHEVSVSPYYVHAIMQWVLNVVPKTTALGIVTKEHDNIRRRALKKLETPAK